MFPRFIPTSSKVLHHATYYKLQTTLSYIFITSLWDAEDVLPLRMFFLTLCTSWVVAGMHPFLLFILGFI